VGCEDSSARPDSRRYGPRIGKIGEHSRDEFVRVRYLHSGASLQEDSRGFAGVLGMGTEAHRATGEDRFENIVSTPGHERAAHERRRRPAIDGRQLTHRIEQKHIAGRQFRSCALGAAPDHTARRARHALDRIKAFRVPRRQHERKIPTRLLCSVEYREERLLLSRMGASPDQERHIA
jgi:hypothetical protein